MSTLTIKDLIDNYELDKEATSVILGGVNDWVRTFTRARQASTPMTVFNISYTTNNTYVDNDYIMVQPQIFNIGNGVQNSGYMSFDVDPMSVSAASPVNVLA